MPWLAVNSSAGASQDAAAALLDPQPVPGLVGDRKLTPRDAGGSQRPGVDASGRAQLAEAQRDGPVVVDTDGAADRVQVAVGHRQMHGLAAALGLVARPEQHQHGHIVLEVAAATPRRDD